MEIRSNIRDIFPGLRTAQKKPEWRNPKSDYPLLCSINANTDLYWQICKDTPCVVQHHGRSRATNTNIPDSVQNIPTLKLKVVVGIEQTIFTLLSICAPLSLTLVNHPFYYVCSSIADKNVQFCVYTAFSLGTPTYFMSNSNWTLPDNLHYLNWKSKH